MISFKRIIQITVPLIVGGLSMNIVNLTDTIFLGQLGAAELGSAGNGSIFYFIFAYVGMGLTSGMQIIIARRNGEKNYGEINALLQSGILMITVFAVFASSLILLGMDQLFSSIYRSATVAQGSYDYLSVRSYGLFFTLFNFAMTAFFVGITKTRVISWVVPLAALLNILLDYLLIFGIAGFPELGIKGAALASVISEATGALLLLGVAVYRYRNSEFMLFRRVRNQIKFSQEIFKLSYPLLLQNFITLGAWFVFFSLIEKLGENELAASHIIRSIYGFLMLPSFSLADATNSLVSNLIGEKKQDQIFFLIKRVIIIGLVFNIICIILNLGFERQIFLLFTRDEAVICAAGYAFTIINLALVILTLAMILFRSLTGTGMTKLSLVLEIISVFIYLTYAVIVSQSEQASINLFWSAEFIYFSLIAVLSYLFLRFGNWRSRAI